MIIVNNLDNETIIGSVSGKTFSVSYSEAKYLQMKAIEARANSAQTMDELRALIDDFEPYTRESYKEMIEQTCPYVVVSRSNNRFYLKYGSMVSSKPMPNELAEKIIKSHEKGIDPKPLVMFWVRFLRNPNYSDDKAKRLVKYITAPYVNHTRAAELMKEQGLSQEVALKAATTTQVAITQEGLLVGYKVSREIFHKYELDENEEVVTRSRYKKQIDPDTGLVTMVEPEYAEERLFQPAVQGEGGDEFYCGFETEGGKLGHFIRVGKVHYLPHWSQVDCNDNRTCCPGLHVGGLSYIKGYQNDGTVTHNIFIDPMHIGAVCDVENSDGALRVKQYFVHSSFKGVNKNLYHSSDYAKWTDAEYDAYVREVVEKTALAKEDAEKFTQEANALRTPKPENPTANVNQESRSGT